MSTLNGPVHGQFDHVTWVTMSPNGPVLANLKLDGILDADIRTEATAQLTERLRDKYEIRLDPIVVQSQSPVKIEAGDIPQLYRRLNFWDLGFGQPSAADRNQLLFAIRRTFVQEMLLG